MTVAQQLKQDEGEILDINKWYLHIKDFSESEINLFFKRIRECVLKRVTSNTTKADLEVIQNTIAGIAITQQWFVQIKKETVDNED
jgi:hypothetical protein